eukprot:TRINITY_DN2954_c0_g1_i1.p1 TRINITY_DN2954_c0_g1~~TRINITY_DN2954_c0_g1_i1.p1  ORF type:complete len:789 (-),score=152.15 TRINITY_DN2954_c0_g1_i1:1406-3772(-)
MAATSSDVIHSGIEIPPNEIVLLELLGSGSYADVYKARCYGIEVAVKIMKSVNENRIQMFKQEAKMLSKIRHPNVYQFIGISQNSDGSFMIVTELLTGGDLNKILEECKAKKGPLSLPIAIRYAREFAKGMIFVHQNNLCHQDLKPHNLMFNSYKVLKVVDFGLASPKTLTPTKTPSTRGSYLWMAPEVMKRMPYNTKADIYSFGIILWQLICSDPSPYPGYSQVDPFVKAVAERGERPPIPTNCLPSIRELMKRCWHADPDKRPTFIEVDEILNSIAIEVNISDENARWFWSNNFIGRDIIPWNEFAIRFYNFLGQEIPFTWKSGSSKAFSAEEEAEGLVYGGPSSAEPLRENATNDQIRLASMRDLEALSKVSPTASTRVQMEVLRRENIKSYKAFRHLLADDQHQEFFSMPGVSMEKFGKITRIFGPIVRNNSIEIFEKIKNVLRQSWFRNNLGRDGAYECLKGVAEPNTFLVRIGSDLQHDFVISMVKDGRVIHVSINNQPGKGFTLRGQVFGDSCPYFLRLDHLIEYAKHTRLLGNESPHLTGSQSIFKDDENVPSSGYIATNTALNSEAVRLQSNHAKAKVPQVEVASKKDILDVGSFMDSLSISLSMEDGVQANAAAAAAQVAAQVHPQFAEHELRVLQRIEAYRLRFSGAVNCRHSDCQFEAIAHQLYGNTKMAAEVRQNAALWLKNNPNYTIENGGELKSYLCNGVNWNDYCEAIMSQSLWGDNVTLVAIAEAYRIKIQIITSIQGHHFLVTISPKSGEVQREVRICQILNVYYESLIP